MLALVRGSWAAVPLHLMLWYLNESELSAVPPDVLSTLGTTYRHLNQRSLRVLKRVISTCVIEGRFVKRNEPQLRLVWTSLVRPKSLNGYLRSVAHHVARPAVARRIASAQRIGRAHAKDFRTGQSNPGV
jgi:hypothetical protein